MQECATVRTQQPDGFRYPAQVSGIGGIQRIHHCRCRTEANTDAAFMQGAAACLAQERIVIHMFRHRPAHPRSELTNRRTIGQSHRKSAGGDDASHCLYPAATFPVDVEPQVQAILHPRGIAQRIGIQEGVSIAGGPPMIDVTVRKAGQ